MKWLWWLHFHVILACDEFTVWRVHCQHPAVCWVLHACCGFCFDVVVLAAFMFVFNTVCMYAVVKLGFKRWPSSYYLTSGDTELYIFVLFRTGTACGKIQVAELPSGKMRGGGAVLRCTPPYFDHRMCVCAVVVCLFHTVFMFLWLVVNVVVYCFVCTSCAIYYGWANVVDVHLVVQKI